jgi:hypothetical protein
MDAWGIGIVVISGLLYALVRKTDDKAAKLFIFTAGIGVGLIAGAVWALVIVNQVMGGL